MKPCKGKDMKGMKEKGKEKSREKDHKDNKKKK